MENKTSLIMFNNSGFEVKQGIYSSAGYHCVLLNKDLDCNQPLILLYDYFGVFKASFSFLDIVTDIKEVSLADEISISHVSLEDIVWFITSKNEYFRLDTKQCVLF